MDITAHSAPATQGPRPRPESEAEGALRSALADSRQRWRDLALLSADLAFETDAEGRFVFVGPDPALGWPAAALIGTRADALLDPASRADAPFRPQSATRGRRLWLRRADGSRACLSFALAPILDPDGRIAGARGLGADVTAQERHESSLAAALRRCELTDHILWRMRQEVQAPRMMQAALAAIVDALGAEGAVLVDQLVDPAAESGGRSVLHQSGTMDEAVIPVGYGVLRENPHGPALAYAPDGRAVLACPSLTRFGGRVGIVLWRALGAQPWEEEDLALVASAIGITRVVLEHEAIQHEMVRQARTDPLTGCLNRRAFIAEIERRIDRLEREALPGTLLFVDLDRFKTLNETWGHEAGDEALCLMADLLRITFRPTDLLARLGGDEFAMWLDGADDLTAAERAEMLRLRVPEELAGITAGETPRYTASIGIATRWPGSGEDIDMLLRRADQALNEVKLNGRGHWRAAQRPPG